MDSVIWNVLHKTLSLGWCWHGQCWYDCWDKTKQNIFSQKNRTKKKLILQKFQSLFLNKNFV